VTSPVRPTAPYGERVEHRRHVVREPVVERLAGGREQAASRGHIDGLGRRRREPLAHRSARGRDSFRRLLGNECSILLRSDDRVDSVRRREQNSLDVWFVRDRPKLDRSSATASATAVPRTNARPARRRRPADRRPAMFLPLCALSRRVSGRSASGTPTATIADRPASADSIASASPSSASSATATSEGRRCRDSKCLRQPSAEPYALWRRSRKERCAAADYGARPNTRYPVWPTPAVEGAGAAVGEVHLPLNRFERLDALKAGPRGREGGLAGPLDERGVDGEVPSGREQVVRALDDFGGVARIER